MLVLKHGFSHFGTLFAALTASRPRVARLHQANGMKTDTNIVIQ